MLHVQRRKLSDEQIFVLDLIAQIKKSVEYRIRNNITSFKLKILVKSCMFIAVNAELMGVMPILQMSTRTHSHLRLTHVKFLIVNSDKF